MKKIGAIISIIILAVLLTIGLPVRGLLAVLTLILAVFFAVIVKKNIGDDGVKSFWGVMEILVKASMGVAIFLVLMLLGSILEGLLIPHRPEKLSLAWNAIAILFSAGLAYVSVKGNRWLTIGIVLAIAFLVLTVQLGFPTYAKTLPNREEISTKYLKKHGTIGGPVLLIWHGAFGPPEPAPTNSVPTGSTSASSATTAEALELMYEGKTPCSTIIDYRFKIIWGDHPLRIIYPGDQIVDREGQGEDFHAPSSMRSGETKFVSLDPLLPRFRVQVYKVVTIQK